MKLRMLLASAAAAMLVSGAATAATSVATATDIGATSKGVGNPYEFVLPDGVRAAILKPATNEIILIME